MQESSAVDSVLNALMSIGRLMRQRYGGETLEPGTFWLLNSLRCIGAMRVTDLAAQLQLDASTVSRQIQQLEKAGLVDRTTDPQDRRAQIVGLSAAGHDILDDGRARRKAALVEHFADWDPDEVTTLERLLNKFVAGIELTESASSRSPAYDASHTNSGLSDSSHINSGHTNPTNHDSTNTEATDRTVAELEHQ